MVSVEEKPEQEAVLHNYGFAYLIRPSMPLKSDDFSVVFPRSSVAKSGMIL